MTDKINIYAGRAVSCEHANCTEQAFVRVGFPENGHPYKEADLCRAHASEHWERAKGAVASLGMPSPVYGQPGAPIYGPQVIAQSRAADRDDRAALA